MRNQEQSITVTPDDLDSVHRKLEQFMQDLPKAERDAMAMILARAASTKAELKDEINAYLLAREGKTGPPTRAVLARAIDGRSRVPRLGEDKSLWSYTVWTYQHK